MKILGRAKTYQDYLDRLGGGGYDLHEEVQQFYDSLPKEELLNYIRNLVELPDLDIKLSLRNEKVSSIRIESEDICHTNKLLGLAFKECSVHAGLDPGPISIKNMKQFHDGADPILKVQLVVKLRIVTNTNKTDYIKLFTASYAQDKAKWVFNPIKR